MMNAKEESLSLEAVKWYQTVC